MARRYFNIIAYRLKESPLHERQELSELHGLQGWCCLTPGQWMSRYSTGLRLQSPFHTMFSWLSIEPHVKFIPRHLVGSKGCFSITTSLNQAISWVGILLKYSTCANLSLQPENKMSAVMNGIAYHYQNGQA